LDFPSSAHYKNRYVLLIAISDYPNLGQNKNLYYSVPDCVAVKSLLIDNFNYRNDQIVLLENATRQDILGQFDRLNEVISLEDSLFIYYAGHGTNQNGEGFIVPTEGERDDPQSWLSGNRLIELIKCLPAKHIFFVADMCFAGSFLRNYFLPTEPADSRSINFLVAGTSLQAVPDTSQFSLSLQKGLSGYAGERADGLISSTELSDYVITELEKQQAKHDVMSDFIIRDTHYNQEFLFEWAVPFLPPELLRQLEEFEIEKRISAAELLGTIQGPVEFIELTFRKLLKTITIESESEVQMAAFRALEKLKYPSSLEAMFELINSHKLIEDCEKNTQDPFLNSALRVIEALEDKCAIIPLLTYLHRSNPSRLTKTLVFITINSLIQLVNENDIEIIHALGEHLTGLDVNYQENLIYLLGNLYMYQAGECLYRFIKDPRQDVDLRREAIAKLAKTGQPAILPQLEQWLAVEQEPLLIRFGNSARKALRKRFGFEDWDENELLYDMGIVVTDFHNPPALEKALNEEGCNRVIRLTNLVTDPENIPIGDRQIAAISLLADESDECGSDVLETVIIHLEDQLKVEENQKLIGWIQQAIEIFRNSLMKR
jgi:HEAT repeat protein